MFGICELFVTPKYWIHSDIDDLIPFNEYFIIPYVLWMILFPGSLIFYMLKSKEDFLDLVFIMFGGATVCFICYILWLSI